MPLALGILIAVIPVLCLSVYVAWRGPLRHRAYRRWVRSLPVRRDRDRAQH